jgi:hypothetical protein
MSFSIFKSRLVCTGIIMWIITSAPVVDSILPPMWKALLDAVLTLLMFYFHVNRSQEYNPVQAKPLVKRSYAMSTGVFRTSTLPRIG